MESSQNSKPVVTATMNVPVDMYDPLPRPRGVVGCIYRAWTSVVFLLYSGIAKPSRCVKNERTSRFFVYMAYWRVYRCVHAHEPYYIVNNKKWHNGGRVHRCGINISFCIFLVSFWEIISPHLCRHVKNKRSLTYWITVKIAEFFTFYTKSLRMSKKSSTFAAQNDARYGRKEI